MLFIKMEEKVTAAFATFGLCHFSPYEPFSLARIFAND